MSWRFLLSAMKRICATENAMHPVDLNLEAAPCVVLCCIAVEAFANEISSLSSAFLFNEKENPPVRYWTEAQEETAVGMDWDSCRDVAKIKDDRKGSLWSFYDRYKALLNAMGIEKPTCLLRLSHLKDLRNALVHFRLCKVAIVYGSDGVIQYAQDPPEVFAHLKSYNVNGWPVVSDDPDYNGVEWTLRVSTNAVAAWSLNLALEAITHVLDHIPAGRYRDSILKAYASRDVSFSNVFEKGKNDLNVWQSGLFANV
jgi:hypothetical protein